LLYVHWGLGEFCDVDGAPGFGGSWPPKFGELVSTYFDVISKKDKIVTDTFLTASDWTSAKFQNLEFGTEGTNKFTEIKTENGLGGAPLYSMKCHSNSPTDKAQGLQLGEYRFKCDFSIKPDGYWVDQAKNANDPNLLLGGISTIENLSTNKGCPPTKRKIALLAFVAGAEVKEEVNEMTNSKEWKSLAVGDAELAFVTKINIIGKDGKDTGRTAAVNAQIKPLASIIDTTGFPTFLKTTRAILFTFDASRDDLKNGESIFFDPTFGYPSNPAEPASGSNRSNGSVVTLAIAVLSVALMSLI